MTKTATKNNKLYHQKRLSELKDEKHHYLKRSRWWVVLRLISFSVIPVTIFLGYPLGGYSAVLLMLELLIFLWFVRKSAENKERLQFTKHLIAINENECEALGNNFSAFDSGERWINQQHPFTYDMDVFGKDGFFQILNRTVTGRGEKTLAQRLSNGIDGHEESLEAVQELSENPNWYQAYLAHGMQQKEGVEDLSIARWSKQHIQQKGWMSVLSFVLPVIAVGLTVLYLLDLIHGLYFSIGAILVLLPIRQVLKQTNQLHQSLSELGGGIKAMQHQLDHLKKIKFQSKQLTTYQKELFNNEKNAYRSVEQLSKLVQQVEYRNNILVALLLNFYLAWDFRVTKRASRWIEENREHIAHWEQLIFEFEALISGANYRRIYADETTAPELLNADENGVVLSELGHPIISGDKRVTNDFTLADDQRFAIITGPNMAGKSTFLRSVGVNIMMAQAGFHVMAKKFVFPNRRLYSSMRTADDLSEETSYFHAELLRLRFIMDAIERGEKVFIILDEILKGTNSKDKEEGSRKFLTKLEEKGACGLIATHDLSLTTLAEEHQSLVNKYFDTNIQGDEISFDYKMREGVAQNMNASFLLRKMKLTD
ncbi:MAG: MutS-related protein [Bacteroidota bacterium]